MLKHLIVSEEKRLDKLLTEAFTDYSRTYFQHLIDKGHVTCQGKILKKREVPPLGSEIQIFFASQPIPSLEPEAIPLDILYEDADIICINKPAGMVVHPAPGNPTGTFVNALLHHCGPLPGEDLRPGIVHRLDKETSGVLIAAKNLKAHKALIKAFSTRTVQKDYLAIVTGNPGNQTVDRPIGRHPVRRKEMTIHENGRSAITHLETLESSKGLSLVRARPVTGRTHQIRVHLKSLNTPVLGDKLYGPTQLSQKLGASRHLLHAHRLTFPHPITSIPHTITAPIPPDFAKFTTTTH